MAPFRGPLVSESGYPALLVHSWPYRRTMSKYETLTIILGVIHVLILLLQWTDKD